MPCGQGGQLSLPWVARGKAQEMSLEGFFGFYLLMPG
jgi:hypothetical protein